MTTFGSFRALLKALRRNPTFTLVAVLTLTFSMGASTAMFSIVDAFLFSSLPYEEADRLVMVWRLAPDTTSEGAPARIPLSPGAFTDLHRDIDSLDSVAAMVSEFATVSLGNEPRRVHLLAVTGEFFPLLGVEASLGRTLGPADCTERASPVVVVGEGYRQREFGSRAEVLGMTVKIGGQEHQIVGVLPETFRFSESLVAADNPLSTPVDLWVPLPLESQAEVRGFRGLMVLARLGADIPLAVAAEELAEYARRAAQRYPETDRGYGMAVLPLEEQIFGPLRPALLALWAATSFVLLIAGANLTTLLLARGERGHQEVAVRMALGADRAMIVRRSLTESVFLSLVGGVLSIPLAFALLKLVRLGIPVSTFSSYPPTIGGQVVAFTLGVSVLVGLLFGFFPALRASRIDPATGLAEGGAGRLGRSRRVFSFLVVAQVALTTTLLIGSGLVVRSLVGLMHADLGLRLNRVVAFDLFLPFGKYRDPVVKTEFLRSLIEGVKTLPGVEGVGINYALPFRGVEPSNRFEIVGEPPVQGRSYSANLGLVNGEYFETLGIPLLWGRTFQGGDTLDSVPVAMVDERMVEAYFNGRDPVGREIAIASDRPLRIVGVVGAVKQHTFEETPRPYIYLPFSQRSYMFTTVAVKTREIEFDGLAASLRQTVTALDPAIPISTVATLEEEYLSALVPHRFSLGLITSFTGLALFLTLVGTYGVMSFLSRQRWREAGLRLALGAAPRQLFAMVVREGVTLSLLGTGLGVVVALSAGRVLRSLIPGGEVLDVGLLAGTALLLFALTFLAYLLPARSLSSVHPAEAMRTS